MKCVWQKLNFVFNKRKPNNKKCSGKKQKLIASGALGSGLLFGRLKTDSDQNHKPIT